MSLAIKITALIALAVVTASATRGGDVSEYYSAATFECCRNNGWDFVIVRSYCSYGGVDSNAPATLRQAAAAGLPYHDVYHFPCKSQSASEQVQADYDHVKGLFGMMWFDIETNPSPGCGWSSDKADNCAFLGSLISAGRNLGIHMGVYASAYMWSSIMGDCNVGADNGLSLWYAHYDGSQSFSDFSSFGGWSKPAMKQYGDSVGICNINADANWYP
eukprot:CAMPEP_0176433454 /NCGR_PEP_ID=MMETSP0127-20121128/16031_1 /TAXON_ID=938130 /ORGANISM="Platyophrya macrostoma, Strain WH" /LENGTH=216 /DNA_ID=CAMNT_0017815883 /DNA_START=86 /DNA_END=736 /DNA_ORIENTATION=+